MKQSRLSSTIISCKAQIQQLCPPHTAINILHIVHDHNKLVHNLANSIKEKKLEHLIPSQTNPVLSDTSRDSRSAHLNTQSVAESKRVVCIPESLPLSDSERSVLEKGLKFIPVTKTVNQYESIRDCERFFRTLRWMAVLRSVPSRPISTNDDMIVQLLQKSAGREPPHNVSQDVELFIHKCTREIKQRHAPPIHKPNLTKAEEVALQHLKSRDDIVIKPADKGGAIVVWHKEAYLAEAEKQLQNPEHYRVGHEGIFNEERSTISSTIRDLTTSGQLPSSSGLLKVTTPRQPRFYLLPKIHKANNPGRPIVSACSCPTEHIAILLDHVLQPFVEKLPSYIKDTNQALCLLEDLNERQTFPPKYVFTMDVVSLYTSIPHGDGLKALEFFLDKRASPEIPTTALLRLAELVLTLTSFQFNGQTYQQVKGVAMGSRMGPSFACLFMGYLEFQASSRYSGPFPEFFRRYIDDCLGVTSLDLTDLMKFIDFMNSLHPSIKFTHQISTQAVEFLDISVSITEAKDISTSVHYKPTSTHAFLHFESSHHPKTKESIPFSQLLRLRRLCSDEDDFRSKCEEMIVFFKDRGYPNHVLDKALDRVNMVGRKDALITNVKGSTERPILAITYHPQNIRLRNVILANWNILTNSKDIGPIFSERPLIAYKRHHSLRDLLVKSTTSGRTGHIGTKPCGRPRCPTCRRLNTGTQIRGPKGTSTVSRSFDCQSYNVVYAIQCSVCSKIYVGETGRTLDTRIREHMSDTKHKRETPVARHFNLPHHSLEDMSVMCLWQVYGDTFDRRSMESHIIHRLGTLTPHGINELA